MSLVQCPKCFSDVSSNTGMCLICGFPVSKSKASVKPGDPDLNPLMLVYQSPIARDNILLPPPKPKPTIKVIDEEFLESSQDGLNCLHCGGGITPDDIKCSHCKTLITRRYCSHCSKLIPDHATICPLCNKDVKEHFLYSKLRRTKILIAAGTAAVFAFVVIFLILQQPESRTTQAQAEQINKPEIHTPAPLIKAPEMHSPGPVEKIPEEHPPAPVAKVPEREISQQQEVKSPEPPVIHEIVPSPTATKSISLKKVVKNIEQTKPAPLVEEPKELPKVEEAKRIAKVEPRPVRPMLSPALQRAIDLKSQQRVLKARSLNHKGYSLIKNGHPSDAIPLLEQAVRSFPARTDDLNYAYALFNLAVAYRMAGKPERAIPLLEERIKINDQRDVVARELVSAKREAGLAENQFN
jgi:tetratricopeptide repeat protein